MLTPVETRALEALDEQELVASLIELIRVPSVTGTDAESDLQHRHAEWLRTAGLDVDVWSLDLPSLLADPAFPGLEAERSEGYGLVGATGDGVPALVLCGHVDVVPIGDRAKWDHDPFSGWIDGTALHGRGACDMKSGVAVNLAVVRALQRSGLRLERPLAVHSVVSEEDGGLGAFATLRRGHTGDVAVIPEPTSDRLVVATAGALTFRLVVPGKAAHGSTRHDGVSALDAYVVLHRAMEELERRRNADVDPLFAGNPVPYAISVGTLHAGDWASSVPDLLVAEGRYGVRLGEDPADARAAFEATIAAAAASDGWMRDNPPAVTWPGGQFGPGALAPDHGLIDEMRAAVRDVGLPEPPSVAAPYGSDLRLYAGLGGIPTLHYGPGDVRFAHAPREQVELAEVFAAARALTLLAVRRCGAHL